MESPHDRFDRFLPLSGYILELISSKNCFFHYLLFFFLLYCSAVFLFNSLKKLWFHLSPVRFQFSFSINSQTLRYVGLKRKILCKANDSNKYYYFNVKLHYILLFQSAKIFWWSATSICSRGCFILLSLFILVVHSCRHDKPLLCLLSIASYVSK